MTYLRLFSLYFKLGILGELEYRANFFVQIFESLLSLLVALGGLVVVFSHTDALAEWLPSELVALVGVHLLLGGLLRFLISPSLSKFTQDIRTGNFDFILLKPVDAQFVSSVQRVEVWKLIDIALGITTISVGIFQLGGNVRFVDGLLFAGMLVAGVVIVYSFWIILATTAFWIIRADNIFQIFNALFVAGRWPVTIYPNWLRVILTFVVPVAFAVTVPAQGLIGRLDTNNTLLALAVAVGLFIVARLFWRRGLVSYAGASA